MIEANYLQHFNGLFDASLIQEISASGIFKSYKANDIVIDLGQELEFIPLLIEGNINVLREDKDGNEILIYVLEAGDTCSMSITCCTAHNKSKIRAIADKDSKLIMIPKQQMTTWFNTNDSWRNFILQSYQVRFNEMLETIDTLAFMKMDERLNKYLVDKVKLNGSEIISTTHQKIAEDLNTSRVVISRLLKQLEREKVIKLSRNRIEVLAF